MSKLYKLGVVGDPIEHSLSPFIHSRFSRETNINIEYLPFKVKEDDFAPFVSDFFKDSLSKGLNITLPHKKNASMLDGVISKEAKYINAVNTIVKDEKKIFLYSTDGVGFIDDIKNKGFIFKDNKILIIGAGGAAESILYTVAHNKPKEITLYNRTIEKAEKLCRKYSHISKTESVLDHNSPYDIVINSSSAGLTGEFRPIEELNISKSTIFYDLNYSLTETPFCKWAKGISNNVYDGIGMLVHQAAHSYNMWFGIFPDTTKVIQDIEDMRG